LVGWLRVIVVGTVDLHDELGSWAVDVGHIWSDRVLAAEAYVATMLAEKAPEELFGQAEVAAVCPR
jgi:hypothetical protein